MATTGRVIFYPEHFCRVTEARDVFGHATTFAYDDYGQFLETTTDALGNTLTAHNNRVLAADRATDPNGNRQASAWSSGRHDGQVR